MRSINLALLSSVFAASAFILSWVAEFNCHFLKFTNAKPTIPPNVHFGIWAYQFWTTATNVDGTYIFETCHTYPDQTGSGAILHVDSKWKAAKAFSVLTLIIGGVVFFSNMIRGCRPKYAEMLFVSRGEAVLYVLTSFFSGMTLIVLDSDLCKHNILMEEVDAASPNTEFGDTCEMSRGAKCVIAATVFWFCAGLTSYQGWKAEKEEAVPDTTVSLTDPLIAEDLS
mmetsp:Transcript_4187/g.8698  ORF Transcript_4187/g.8698 Transcript_4187/m.8698 type:complete len:226 (-) Transcript_4187:40-717(-)